jgi:Tol biopolymer transport system component
MIFRYFFIAVFCLFELLGNAQTYDESPSGFFFSDEVGEQPMLMSPGFISTGMNELHGSMAPDGDEFYYCLSHQRDLSIIMVSRFSDGFWGFPEVAVFSGEALDANPFVTPDGKFLYFTSNRAGHETDGIANWNIWRCSRLDDESWGQPQLLPFSSPDRNEMSVSVDREGIVYFHADYESETISVERSFFDIYCVRPENDTWGEIEKLGPAVNSDVIEQTPAISPAGDVLVFSSVRREGYGVGDLYISFKTERSWSQAVNMGQLVNSGANEYCPAFIADRKLLLFTSFVKNKKPDKLSFTEIKKWVLGPGNGVGDFWYMSAGALDQFRSE